MNKRFPKQEIEVLSAEFCNKPGFAKSVGRSIPQKRGLVFEAKIQNEMADRYDGYVGGSWIRYYDFEGKRRFCSPDGLHFNLLDGIITIVEIKWQHTIKAFYQLRNLYYPVVRNLFSGNWSIAMVEVVSKWVRLEDYPTEVVFVKEIDRVEPDSFGVVIA